MPCWTVRTYEVEAGKMEVGHLAEALTALGFAPQVTESAIYFARGLGRYERSTGRMTLPNGVELATIKVAYSHRVVAATAKKMGWQVKVNTTDKNKMRLTRRA